MNTLKVLMVILCIAAIALSIIDSNWFAAIAWINVIIWVCNAHLADLSRE